MVRLTQPHIKVKSKSDLIRELANFDKYIDYLIDTYRQSDIFKFYVDLSCLHQTYSDELQPLTQRRYKPIDNFVNQWLQGTGKFLSVLGDFGVGKSWFCQHYAYNLALEYKRNPYQTRVPIYIDLGKQNYVLDLWDVISSILQVGGNSYLEEDVLSYLNLKGKFLLIFDGFDEMEQKLENNATTADNFYRLHRFIGNSDRDKPKVILTSRSIFFRSNTSVQHFLQPSTPNLKWLIDDRQLIALGGKDRNFDVITIELLEPEEIKKALEKRIPDTWQTVYDKIQSIYDLGGLSGRPVLLDLITKLFPDIEDVENVDQHKLYEMYFNKQFYRHFKEGISPTTPSEREQFIGLLAWTMFWNQEKNISASRFSEMIQLYFNVETTQDIEKYAQDIRTQLYLKRDENDNYEFGHPSFAEYMVARHIFSELKKGKDLATTLGEKKGVMGERLYVRGIYKFLKALTQPGDEEFLIPLLRSPYTWERFLTVYLLGRPKDASYKSQIIQLLEQQISIESDVMTRREIAYALARLGKEQYIESFVQELKQNVNLMREVYQIGYFKYHLDRGGAIYEIKWRLINKIDQSVRSEYVHFLGEYGDSTCVSAIALYLNDVAPIVRQEAREALEKLSLRWGKTVNVDTDLYNSRQSIELENRYRIILDQLTVADDFLVEELNKSRDLFHFDKDVLLPKEFNVWTIIAGIPVSDHLAKGFTTLIEQIQELLPQGVRFFKVPPHLYHWELYIIKRPIEILDVSLLESVSSSLETLLGSVQEFRLSYRGFLITPDGTIVAKGYTEANIDNLRFSFRKAFPFASSKQSNLGHISLARILDPVGGETFEKLKKMIEAFSETEFGELIINEVKYVNETQWYMQKHNIITTVKLDGDRT
jgi:hypothetical protein